MTYLPAFITTVFHGMPGVWKGQHRLLLCWLIVMQTVYPGRKTLHELALWSPRQITEWRLRRLLSASYWFIPLLIEWLAHDVIAQWPPPKHEARVVFASKISSRVDKEKANNRGYYFCCCKNFSTLPLIVPGMTAPIFLTIEKSLAIYQLA